MIFFIWGALFVCLISAICQAKENTPPLAEYSTSIHRYGRDQANYKRFLRSPANASFLALFERLYQQNLRIPFKACSIPKIIHQIWLGSPFPKKFKKISKTWKNLTGWEYKLWTDAEVKTFPMLNRKLFESITNYGAKSDILRYEILYQEGGLYVDIDFECLNPKFFDWAQEKYDFYAGTETLQGCTKVNVCNALMGAKKGHPLLKLVIDSISRIEKLPTLNKIVEATGPGALSYQFLEYNKGKVDTLDIVFTPTYFYPVSKSEFKLKEKAIKKLLKTESAALHYWAGTWLHSKVDGKALFE